MELNQTALAVQKPDTVLRVRGLSVDIPVAAGMLHAVSDVGFEVHRGETLCIVGESGCGKSMTALALMKLLPEKALLKAEELALEGVDLLALGRRQFAALQGNRIGMIFQDPMTSLNPVYSIAEQMVEVYVRHGKGNRREARERAVFLLEKVGIRPARNRLGQYPHQLSGGLRQRVMIAMTLMCNPSLIIADEPTTALDVTIQAQILRLLRSLQREFHTSIILITHDLGVVAAVADRVAVMYAGRIVETGSSRELFERPLHPYTRALLGCIPIPGKSLPGSRLESIPGIVPALIGEFEGCAFRNRCGEKVDACSRGTITFRESAPGRGLRCVHEQGIAAGQSGSRL